MSALMPGERMALNIFEPRYRLMVRRVMEGSRRFGMATVDRNHQLCDVSKYASLADCATPAPPVLSMPGLACACPACSAHAGCVGSMEQIAAGGAKLNGSVRPSWDQTPAARLLFAFAADANHAEPAAGAARWSAGWM